MKNIFLVLSVLFFGISVFGQTPVCPPIDPIFGVGALTLIADPTCCSRYYECERGIPIPKECPDGLLFDSKNQICTWWWEPNAVFDCMAGSCTVSDTCPDGAKISCTGEVCLLGDEKNTGRKYVECDFKKTGVANRLIIFGLIAVP